MVLIRLAFSLVYPSIRTGGSTTIYTPGAFIPHPSGPFWPLRDPCQAPTDFIDPLGHFYSHAYDINALGCIVCRTKVERQVDSLVS